MTIECEYDLRGRIEDKRIARDNEIEAKRIDLGSDWRRGCKWQGNKEILAGTILKCFFYSAIDANASLRLDRFLVKAHKQVV